MNITNNVLALFSMLLFATAAFAQPTCVAPEVQQDIVVDFTGVESVDGPGAPGNTILTVCNPALANGMVTFIDIQNMEAVPIGASWCSEVTLDFGPGLFTLNPHVENNPGPCAPLTLPNVDLVAAGVGALPADAAGCVMIEISESFDDVAGAVDAIFASGIMTLSGCGEAIVEEAAPIPTLGEWGMIALVLLMLILGVTYLRTESVNSSSIA